MTELGKILVGLGAVLLIVGALLWSGVGRNWIGRLPGDFSYHRGNFSFYFPLATSILLSLLLTLIFWLLRR